MPIDSVNSIDFGKKSALSSKDISDEIFIDKKLDENMQHLINQISYDDPQEKVQLHQFVNQAIEESASEGKIAFHRLLAKVLSHYQKVSFAYKEFQKTKQKKIGQNIHTGTRKLKEAQESKATVAKGQLIGSVLLLVAALGFDKNFIEAGSQLIAQGGNILNNQKDGQASWHSNMVQKLQSEFSTTGQKMTSSTNSQQEVIRILQSVLDSLSSEARSQ